MQDSNFRDMVTADIQRHLGWAGLKPGDVHALIWGAAYHRSLKVKIRKYLIDRVWNRFQMNAFKLSEANMAAFAKQVQRRSPRLLFGYAASINQFAHFIRHSPFKDISFDSIVVTAELLLPSARQNIEETFRGKAFNRYGTLDLGGVACECPAHTGLHVSLENNFVEILCGGSQARPGEVGEIIVTNLNNLGMPFIRYSIDDAGAWYEGGDCPCGRQMPMLDRIEGRITEMFITRDGRSIRAAFSSGFKCLAHPAIRQFQVIQKSLDEFTLRLVTSEDLPQAILENIARSFQVVFGETARVNIEFLEEIPALPSGKHAYAVSEVSKGEHRINEIINV